MRLRAVPLAAICFLAATMFAVPGCTDRISRPEDHDHWDDGPRDITSPEAALLALKDAYRERESAAMDSLLSADFIFELSPEDASMPGMPDGWERSGELAIYAQMFDADLVQSLALDFVIGPRVFDDVEQLWTITITRVDLLLYGLTPDHPTPKMYRVENDSAKFWFRPMTWNARGTDDRAWKIVKWQDEFVEGAQRRGLQSPPEGGSNTTWGYIKWLYRPQP
jgi:hypothetical protein